MTTKSCLTQLADTNEHQVANALLTCQLLVLCHVNLPNHRFFIVTLQRTNKSHLEKGNIILKNVLGWDMLVFRRAYLMKKILHQLGWDGQS